MDWMSRRFYRFLQGTYELVSQLCTCVHPNRPGLTVGSGPSGLHGYTRNQAGYIQICRFAGSVVHNSSDVHSSDFAVSQAKLFPRCSTNSIRKRSQGNGGGSHSQKVERHARLTCRDEFCWLTFPASQQ